MLCATLALCLSFLLLLRLGLRSLHDFDPRLAVLCFGGVLVAYLEDLRVACQLATHLLNL